jgi:hypothetical protein
MTDKPVHMSERMLHTGHDHKDHKGPIAKKNLVLNLMELYAQTS